MQVRELIVVLSGLYALTFSIPSHGENWVYVTDEKVYDGGDFPIYTRKFYIDTDSKTSVNDNIMIWQKFVHPDRRDDTGKPFRQDRVYYFLMEYDCDKKTKSLLRYDRFDAIFPSESFDWVSIPNKRVESIVLGSPDENIFNAVCGSN